MKRAGKVLLLGLVLSTAGCARNAATIDIAKEVSQKSDQAMQGVATYFDDVETRRQRAAAAVVASDPSCLPRMPLQVQFPREPRGKQGPLCRNGKVARGHDPDVLDFSTTPDDVLKPRLMLIAAVADYGTALGKIAADPAADVNAELTGFAQKVDRVGSFLELLGYDGPSLGGQITSDEGKAIANLLDFAVRLRHEANQVRNIKVLVATRGHVVDEAIDQLEDQIATWGQGDLAGVSYAYTDALERAYRNNRYRMSFAERQSTAQSIFEAQAEEKSVPSRSKTVLAALDETHEAQVELRGALLGKFSEKRKRQIAKENLDRITKALGMIAALGKTF